MPGTRDPRRRPHRGTPAPPPRPATADLRGALRRAREDEAKFRAFFENAIDVLVCAEEDGRMTDINEAVRDVFGYAPEELLGKSYFDLDVLAPATTRRMKAALRRRPRRGAPPRIEFEAFRKDGTPIFVEVTFKALRRPRGGRYFVSIVRDITARKKLERQLRDHRQHLEELVRERTATLEDTNAALKVLLKRRENDKAELEEKITHNVRELLLPHVERLRAANLTHRQQNTIDMIEANLNEVISPFAHKLTSRFFNLTPAELQVANYIKHGRSTKAIAELLGVSANTVRFHRARIRSKLGLKRAKSNLRSYLRHLPE